jgi:diadenosine tetraphosphatase ApaH/serine/threonine PP2A family protein phosphatase
MLFLGGYVNRGNHQLHVICLLLLLKARYPDSYFLLRGDDEWRGMNCRMSDGNSFANACREGFEPDRWQAAWNLFNDIFEFIPIAAVVDERIFCAYGGLPTNFDCLQDYEYASARELRPISGRTPASCRFLAFAESEDDDSAIDEVRSRPTVCGVGHVARSPPPRNAMPLPLHVARPFQDVLPQFLHNSRLTMFVRASQRPTLLGYTMLPDTKLPFSVSLSPSVMGKGVVLKVHGKRPVKVDLVPSTLVEPLTPPNPLISFMRDLILGI